MYRRLNARTAAARKLKNAAVIRGHVARRLERQRAQVERDITAGGGYGQPYLPAQALAQLAARRYRKTVRRLTGGSPR